MVIEESPVVVELPPLPRQHRFEVGGFSTLGQLKGAGVEGRWYALPDRVFAGLRDYVYAEGGGRWWMPEVVVRNQSELVVGAYLVGGVSSTVRLWMESGYRRVPLVRGGRAVRCLLPPHRIGGGLGVGAGWTLCVRTRYVKSGAGLSLRRHGAVIWNTRH